MSVLGDDHFAYIVEQGDGASPSLLAVPPAGGATTTLGATTAVELVAADSCNVYFSSGGTLQRVAKPTP